MKKDITICIGTIGNPTFKKCKSIIKRINANDQRVKKIVVIDNHRPQCAWLNKMIQESLDTTWCLQIDEDMYIHDNAIDVLLHSAAKKESLGVGVGLSHGLLWDLFLKTPVGSLKLWRTKILKKFEFPNTLGSDRAVVNAIKKRGYKIASTDQILGHHDSAPTIEIGKRKYFEYVQKIKKFDSEKKAVKFINYLKSINAAPEIIKSAELGLKEDIIDKSKG